MEYQNDGTMSRLAKDVKKGLREGLVEVSELSRRLERLEKSERSGRGLSGNVSESLSKVKYRVDTLERHSEGVEQRLSEISERQARLERSGRQSRSKEKLD